MREFNFCPHPRRCRKLSEVDRPRTVEIELAENFLCIIWQPRDVKLSLRAGGHCCARSLLRRRSET